ncbi:MAG: sigma-54-dependent transcriptional regulator [Anaerolineaceae bacterium]
MGFTVLIIDDEDNARINITDFLSEKGFQVLGAGTLAEGKKMLESGDPDIVLLDIQLPDGYGPNLLYETAQMPSRPPIILITGYGDIETAVDAMKNGAHDFFTKPIQFSQLEKSIERACEIVRMRRELAHIHEVQSKKINFVVGETPEMGIILQQSQRAAQASVSVLITGESGVGKDVLAKFIHQTSPRASKAFMDINCAAIQSTVLESELFGYEAGAFTGAERKKIGLMEVADGGILFLDEISSMPLDIQAKLLRALEERAFRRVGGTATIKVDVHLLAASNRDLKALIKEEKFREDLYFRLKVVDLHLAPLRERKVDIPELAGFFVREFNARLGINVTDITPRAMKALVAYDWPGNIRELRNAIERAMLFCDDAALDINHLPADVIKATM